MATDPISDAVRDVLNERARQIADEGFSLHHDDEHDRGEMAAAAATYAWHASLADHVRTLALDLGSHAAWVRRILWPNKWGGWFKPKDRRADLVRAGALIIAEIERLDRAATKSKAA